VTELVLSLHECAAEPFQDVAESIADPATAEPLHSIADPAGSGATLTEAFYLCVQV
jgi:hypothetical protein